MNTDIQTKDTTKVLDYQAMWERLRTEIEYLTWNNANIFHPVIVLQYMGFIREIEEAKREEQGNGT